MEVSHSTQKEGMPAVEPEKEVKPVLFAKAIQPDYIKYVHYSYDQFLASTDQFMNDYNEQCKIWGKVQE